MSKIQCISIPCFFPAAADPQLGFRAVRMNFFLHEDFLLVWACEIYLLLLKLRRVYSPSRKATEYQLSTPNSFSDFSWQPFWSM